MKVGLLGFGSPILFVAKTLQAAGVEISGIQQDYSRGEEEQSTFEQELSALGIPLFSDLQEVSTDLIFVMNYNRIIDVSQYGQAKLVNLHMGILPTWRGNSANSWAVLNGENGVGYTLHEVNEELDAGAIYYTCRVPVDLNATYSAARKEIYEDIAGTLAGNLLAIYDGSCAPVSQDGSSFVYCAKIRRKDGVIRDWDVTADFLLRKHYLFGPPGSGLSFHHKGQTFQVGALQKVTGFQPALGVPGSVVYIKDNSLWIKVKDTAVAIGKLKVNEAPIQLEEFFKIGNRLSN